jgi:predicted membrane GTPase involved in stress response
MVVGLHSRDNDLVVNPVKTKQLTNIRAAGKDEAMLLTPPIRHTLESAVEFIADDELVEITPSASAQAPAARARAQTRLPRRRLSPDARVSNSFLCVPVSSV